GLTIAASLWGSAIADPGAARANEPLSRGGGRRWCPSSCGSSTVKSKYLTPSADRCVAKVSSAWRPGLLAHPEPRITTKATERKTSLYDRAICNTGQVTGALHGL